MFFVHYAWSFLKHLDLLIDQSSTLASSIQRRMAAAGVAVPKSRPFRLQFSFGNWAKLRRALYVREGWEKKYLKERRKHQQNLICSSMCGSLSFNVWKFEKMALIETNVQFWQQNVLFQKKKIKVKS